jgi:2-aminobenzoate-CoA ligase
MVVKAYVVLAGGAKGDAALTQALQDHVKQTIAPYKYPRAIDFVGQLPKPETGKLRRFALRQMAAAGPASPGVAAE